MHRQHVLNGAQLFHIDFQFIGGSFPHPVADFIHFCFHFKKKGKGGGKHVADGHAFFQRRVLIQVSCLYIFCPFYFSFIGR